MQRRCGAKIQSFGDGAERAVRYLPQEDEIRRSILVSHYSKYGRILAYFLSPIPFTFFKSSALRNGRAAIIRAAITWPIPGTVVSSFSVAVLMSILPSGVFSFACDFLSLAGLAVGAAGLGAGVAETEGAALANGCGVALATFDGWPLMPHPPIFFRFASSSSCSSFWR